mgnify:CR=1 FL=1
MVVAIVAAIVALLLVVAVILIVFAVRNRSKGSFASVKKSVRSIDSVGVSSSLAESEAKKPAAGTKVSSVNPADALKPRRSWRRNIRCAFRSFMELAGSLGRIVCA